MADPRTTQAIELMAQFAARTGLTPGAPPRRYLWTDAFAVCNYLALHAETREDSYLSLALQLVDQVHGVLGRHRPDAPHQGWLSGYAEAAGAEHPTRSGLRIGKPLPERGPHEPFDEELEWDRDGQYFHYLTKWMHALDLVARATGSAAHDEWAGELAAAAHQAFAYTARTGVRRMYWKLSIDLSRPLVSSMGHHDPLDGLVTGLQLARVPEVAVGDYAAMLDPRTLATADPLGLGGLLSDACRVQQLREQGAWPRAGTPLGSRLGALLESLLEGALLGLRRYERVADLGAPPERRLAFRELGLAIGLAGLDLVLHAAAPRAPLSPPAVRALAELAAFAPLRDEIEATWLDPAARRTRLWREHADINDVMLATSLVPAGFLRLPARATAAPAATVRQRAG